MRKTLGGGLESVNTENVTLRQLIVDKFREVDKNFDTVIENFERLADKQVDYFYQADSIKLQQDELDKKFSEILYRLEYLERHARLANWIVRQVVFLTIVGAIAVMVSLWMGG